MLRLLLLLLPLLTRSGFLGGKLSSKPGLSFSQPTSVPTTPSNSIFSFLRPTPAPDSIAPVVLAPKPAAIGRPLLVPALSYAGLAGVAVGAGKLITAAGYGGVMLGSVTMPVATIAAIAAPAVLTYAEFRFLGGGSRVAKMMGGVPADAPLTRLAHGVATKAGLPPPAHVFEIPTDELNAFAAGFGRKDATVAVTSGLRRTLSDAELEAVLAHEIGHIRHSDMRTNMHVAVAIAGLGGIYEFGRLIVRSESRSSSRPKKRKKDDKESGGSALPLGLGMMAAGVASRCVAHLMQMSMSRTAEFDADAVAAELVGSEAMISALSKIQTATEERKRARRAGRRSWFSSEPQPAAALSSFRGGAFAHSYISDGRSDEDKAGKGGFWSKVGQALSTHPTTERRIAALRAKAGAGK